MSFLYWLSNFRNDISDNFFLIITNPGDITVIITILCIIYWCINKKLAYYALLNFFITGAIVQGAKIAFRIPRPWVIDPSFSPVEKAVLGASGYSFPSGHTQASSSIYLTLSHYTKKKYVSVLMYFIVILVMLSRMYLGCHTPLDVLAAFILSIITIKLMAYFLESYSISKTDLIGLLILIGFYSVGVCFFAYLLVRWNISSWELVADSITFCGALLGFSIGSFIEYRYINFSTRCFRFITQIFKLSLGIAGIVAIYVSIELLPLNYIICDFLKSLLICLWATGIFPFFIKLVQKKQYSDL